MRNSAPEAAFAERPPAEFPRAAAGDALLEARAVSLTYRTKKGSIAALRDLTLSIRNGEFVAIVGPSGCGKSTFLKIASGLIPPSSGTVTLTGRAVTRPRSDVGVVFQKPSLMPWKTVLNNVLVATTVLGMDRAKARQRALDLLRMVGLDGFVDNYPGELSGGMQQRVGLVRGLVHDPSLLLMDEPFAALDAMTRESMNLELQRLWMTTDKSVIFITHSILEAVFLADRVLVMSDRPGRVIDEVAVPFPRPRGLETMAAPAFGELCNRLRARFTNMLALD